VYGAEGRGQPSSSTEAQPGQKSRRLRRRDNIVGGIKSLKAPSQRRHGRGHMSVADWLSTKMHVNCERL
jgi:hypothetical protein